MKIERFNGNIKKSNIPIAVQVNKQLNNCDRTLSDLEECYGFISTLRKDYNTSFIRDGEVVWDAFKGRVIYGLVPPTTLSKDSMIQIMYQFNESEVLMLGTDGLKDSAIFKCTI